MINFRGVGKYTDITIETNSTKIELGLFDRDILNRFVTEILQDLTYVIDSDDANNIIDKLEQE